jgi:uncharacterized protein YfdQ (DUF2303 family)
MEAQNIVDSSAALAVYGLEPKRIDGGAPFVVVPKGYVAQDMESSMLVPVRKRGSASLTDAQSFISYVLGLKSEQTRLYGQANPPKFTAIFNDHTGADAGWQDHRAVYACPLSVEWREWIGKNGAAMSQEAFAKFIEDNAPDIVTPSAADMIEIARTLEAKKKVNFASGIRLDNGATEFTYEEDIQGTAAKGRLQVPQVFTIGVPVLENGPRYAVNARLRYRIADKGALTLWFDLERPHKIVEDAAREVRDVIQTETGLQVFNGAV